MGNFNFHPPLASFPVALLSVIFFLEILLISRLFSRWGSVLRHTVTVNIILATIAVIATFFSGYRAMDLAILETSRLQDAVAYHQNLGRLLLFSMLACFAFYVISHKAQYLKNFFWMGYYLLLLLCMMLVIFTGYIGGDLVFTHAVGVRSITK